MKKLPAFILALSLFLSGCGAVAGGTEAKPGGSTTDVPAQNRVISSEEAYARMQSGDPIVIVDVRTAEEYAESHIPGAILVPLDTIGDRQPELLSVLDAELLIYCRSGNRSAQAAAALSAMGYTNLSDFGGINDWPYETEAGEWETEKAGTLNSFRAVDLQGVPADENIYADHKLTMVNVWATFCGYCLNEMPDISALAEVYADRGFQVVGIVTDTMNSNGEGTPVQIVHARDLAVQTGASYRHLMLSPDLNQMLAKVQSVPTTFFVDGEGNQVGETISGARSKSDWTAIIESMLTEVGA